MSTRQSQLNGKAQPWHGPVVKSGFAPINGGFRRGDLTLLRSDGWYTLRGEPRARLNTSEVTTDHLGQMGLWRWIPAGELWLPTFEFPAPTSHSASDDTWSGESEDPSGLDAYLAWALASQDGRLPKGWKAPARKLVLSWLPDCMLTVRSGSIVRQGELIITPGRWTLKFTVLAKLPPDLLPERRLWIHDVLADALQHWRMVRAGFTKGATPAIIAEIDLSGAPHSENLFSVSLNALRHVVALLAEPIELLADSGLKSEILAVRSSPQPKPDH